MIYFFICLFIGILYTVIPYILSRWIGLNVYRKGIQTKKIALTFDDGPNPKYTNELLDLLKIYGIQASFFIVGANAEKYPEIILRMHKEGHLIGIHNYVHHSNWFMTPWMVRHEVVKTTEIIQNIIGEKPVFYRPPWGMMNLFDFFIHKGYKIILWSKMAGDWKSKGGSIRVESILLKTIKPGDIVLLHDNGETFGADWDAPQYTIQALKVVLQNLLNKGYSFARIDEVL